MTTQLHESLYRLRHFIKEVNGEMPKVRLSFPNPRAKARFEAHLMQTMPPEDRCNPKNDPTRGRYQLVGLDLVLLVEDR